MAHKTLADYMSEYNEEVIAKAIPGIHDFAMRPEVWIYFRWEEEQDVNPWEKGFGERLMDVMQRDPELGCYLLNAFEIIHVGLHGAE